jgi:nitrate/TMAO reductase-like tetraheme cytochrome c subunit
MIIFLFTVTTILATRGSYIGLIIYIILPAIMITGLILIPIGMLYKSRQLRRQKTHEAPGWPKIDLNIPTHRNASIVFLIGTTVFLFLSAIGSYEAFHFSESVTFCGTICHEVMKPEYTAYQTSAHARVACVDCHVGSGADWYMRSKLSGLYQIYAVAADNFPRPIETPITNLRPAQETCEECHWPQKFYSRKLRQERHYLTDEQNSEWDIQLAMKIGAEYSALGLREGIHWHINPDIKVEFISLDKRLETIEWIRYTNLKTGLVKTYQDPDNPVDPETLKNSDINTMDCMDCHNRPSHHYRPPYYFINEAITAGSIPVELPEIKSLAMEICSEEFETTSEASAYIRKTIEDFYKDNHPEVNTKLVQTAISGMENVYFKNMFPEMKVRWDAYPNFI